MCGPIDRMVQGLTFFCYFIKEKSVSFKQFQCIKTEINDYYYYYYEKVVTEKSVTYIKLPLVTIFRTKHISPKIKTVCAYVANHKIHKQNGS